MKIRTTACVLAASLSCPWAVATTQLVDLNILNSSTTLATPFQGNESLLANTLVTGPTGAMTNTIIFSVGAGVTSFSGAAAWEIGSAAASDPRLIGVNVDVFNVTTNTLVASDTIVGTAAGFATSTLTGALTPGQYRMVMTGNAVRTGSLDVSLTFSGTPSAQPGPAAAGFLQQSSTIVAPVGVGETVLIDNVVLGRTGPLRNAVTFTAGAGVTGFTSQAAWEVTPAAEAGPRLTGVNVDLFDAANNLLFSDVFNSVLGSFALSSFSGALDPGTYTLVATGTAVRDVMLDVSLTLTGGQVTAVPEPQTYALMLAGLAAIGAVGRRRRNARR